MSTENPKAAAPTAALNANEKSTDRLALLVALAQPGKPLYEFWQNPGQPTLTKGVARIAIAMTKAGKSEQEVINVLKTIQAANASALRQVFESKITLPAGSKEKVATPTADLSALGL